MPAGIKRESGIGEAPIAAMSLMAEIIKEDYMKNTFKLLRSIAIVMAVAFILNGCATNPTYPADLSYSESKELFDKYPITSDDNNQLVGFWVNKTSWGQVYEFSADGICTNTYISSGKIRFLKFEYRVSPKYIVEARVSKNARGESYIDYQNKAYYFEDNKLFLRHSFVRKGESSKIVIGESYSEYIKEDSPRLLLAKEAFDCGQEAYHAEDFDLAIAEYTKALEYESKYTEASNMLKNAQINFAAFVAAADPKAVAEYLQKLVENPGDETISRILSIIYKNNGASVLKPEDLNNAIVSGRKALSQNDDLRVRDNLGQVLILQGDMYMDCGDFAKALASYRESILVRPDIYRTERIYSSLSSAFINSRNEKINKATSEVNVLVNEKYGLARASYAKKDYAAAIAHYEEALKIDPNRRNEVAGFISNIRRQESVEKTYELAVASYDKKDYTTAIAQYSKVLELDPSHSDARNNRKLAWDKRIAESQNLYPAPFQGTWQHTIPASTFTTPGRTETYTESERIWTPNSRGGGEWGTRTTTRTRTTPGTRYTTPEMKVVYRFTGNNYTIEYFTDNKPGTRKTGAFYYSGSTIELDDETVLQFVNNKIVIKQFIITDNKVVSGNDNVELTRQY